MKKKIIKVKIDGVPYSFVEEPMVISKSYKPLTKRILRKTNLHI